MKLMELNKLIYIITGFIFLLLFFLILSDLIIMSFLIIVSLFISYFIYFSKIKSIGFEFITFVVVITGFVYGSTWGAVTGLFLISFHILISQYLGPYVLWVIPEYILLGFVAGFFQNDIIIFGIISTILINTFNIIMTFFTYRENIGKYFVFVITNILFNFFLFYFLAEFILNLLI